MRLRTASGRTLHRNREKSGSRALPGTSRYGSRTVNTMVCVSPTDCSEIAFSVTFDLLLAPFSGPWAPQWRPRREKEASGKTPRKQPPHKAATVPKMTPTWSPTWTISLKQLGFFLGPGRHLKSLEGAGVPQDSSRPDFPHFPSLSYQSYSFLRGKMRHKLAAQCPEFVQLSGAAVYRLACSINIIYYNIQ